MLRLVLDPRMDADYDAAIPPMWRTSKGPCVLGKWGEVGHVPLDVRTVSVSVGVGSRFLVKPFTRKFLLLLLFSQCPLVAGSRAHRSGWTSHLLHHAHGDARVRAHRGQRPSAKPQALNGEP